MRGSARAWSWPWEVTNSVALPARLPGGDCTLQNDEISGPGRSEEWGEGRGGGGGG